MQRMTERRLELDRLGGRPPRQPIAGAEGYAERLRELTPLAIRKLEQRLACGDPRVELQAAVKILEHAIGKPRQRLAVEDAAPSVFVWRNADYLFGAPDGNGGAA
jgi:hypothetical protein